jgi:protein arginine kinase activator
MLCQECRKRPATVHITRIVNGRKAEMSLCEQCAREKGELEFLVEPQFPIQSFLAGLLQQGAVPMLEVSAPAKCETCGLTFEEFSRTGRLGCSGCYERFGDRLDPVLRRIHGSARHTGKVPARSGEAIKVRRELARLREALAEAVKAEEFEKAAELRDEIKRLEKETETG